MRSRYREPFFVGWSIVKILVIAVALGADESQTSPLALLFFIPFVYDPAARVQRVLRVLPRSHRDPLHVVRAQPGSKASGPGAHLARRLAHRLPQPPRVRRAVRGGAQRGRALGTAARALPARPRRLQGNDTKGHAVGDDLLIWVVETLQKTFRPTDWIGWLGGDEFAVLLPGASRGNAEGVSGRVRYALTERVGASIGVAVFPIDGAGSEDLLRTADAELYERQGDRGPRRRDSASDRKELSWSTTLANAVDTRMAVQHEHSTNVGEYAAAIGVQMGWTEDQVGLLRMTGILHDVGKVVVPDRILREPGPLTEDEFETIKPFPAAGADLVARIEGMEPILPWIRHSHERVNGTGYPDGLNGEAIPMGARIVHVADAYDSMTSKRTYRPAMSLRQALYELRAGAGTQFDPDCVAALDEYVAGARAA